MDSPFHDKMCAYRVVIVWCCTLLVTVGAQSCAEEHWEVVHRRLGTKTPYRHVFREVERNPVELEGCRVTKTWGLFRHGTRNPKTEVIDAMHRDLVEIRNEILQHKRLCRRELELFRAWTPARLDPDSDEKLLVSEGADELREIGRRFRRRYGRALPERYNSKDFYFKFTKTERAEYSARNFSLGLFGVEEDIRFPEALAKDPVLRFYKLCERWRLDIKHNPEASHEVNLWYKSKIMKQQIKHVSKKIGTYLDADSIYLIYQTCAFETAWTKRHVSPWCLLLDRYTFEALVFGEDLEYYWIDGYGHELTYAQACSAFRDLFERFDNEDGAKEAFTFYFTHSGTLLKAMAFLGLYRDDYPLTHRDFERKRQWRVSEIDAFATNLVFTKLECSNETKVLLTHQERPVPIPGCSQPGQTLCSYEDFRQLFRERIESCAFEGMCAPQNVPKREEL
uniref:Multiple inositol polyphosphate phosphatase 1 n=2 Tax=Culex pipiens TaxID=7175 RepID=A0A8D8PKH4_CULPI